MTRHREQSRERSRERSSWLFAALSACAVALIVAAYSNSFGNAFHFDDSHVVEGNLYIRSLSNLPRFFRDASTFSSLPANATYRPLVTATLAFDYWVAGGLHVRQFHISQLAMLVALGVMLSVFFRDVLEMAIPRWWNRYAALMAATLFSVHTTGTETMNLMHARSELLSAMGIVGSFLLYIHAPRLRRFHLYLAPMIVGALAKSPAAIFAPLFFVFVCLFEQDLSAPDILSRRAWPRVRAALVRSLPAFAAGIAVFLFVESMNAAGATYGGGGRIEYLRTQLYVWLHYARLFVVPAGLTADTDWRLIPSWYDARVIAGLLFAAALVRLGWISSRDPEARPAAFGIVWFGLALLPASSVFPLAEVTNEHRVFLPFIGLSLAAVAGAALAVERWSIAIPRVRRPLGIAAAATALAVVSANAAGTYERNAVWLTEETLWRDVTEKSPANGRGLMNYGLTQMAKGNFAEAKLLFDRAQVHTPNYGILEVNLGIVTDRIGDPAAAERHFARAVELMPADPATHYFYARWLADRARTADAIPHLRQAIDLSPAHIDARYLLMSLYAREGHVGDLTALARGTLAVAPGDATARRYLDRREADMPDALLNVSLGRYRAGDYQGSIDAARQVLTLKHDSAEAYNNIAASYASMRQWDDAIQAAREALRLKPDFALARNNLAWAETERQKTFGSK